MKENKKRHGTILFLCPSLVGAGVERRVCVLVNCLNQLDFPVLLGILRNEGQFIDKIPANQLVYVEAPLWIRLLLLPVRQLYNIYNFLLAIYQIDRLLRTTKPALLITFTLETTIPTYLVRLFSKSDHLIWVISEDSNTPEAVKSAIKYRWLSALTLKVLSKIYRKADHTIAVSNSVRDAVRSSYKVSDKTIRVVFNPIDPSLNNSDGPCPMEGTYLLAVGRLVKIKQFDLLLRAFAQIRKRKELKLVILGEGPEENKLRELSKDLGMATHVIFAGFTSNPWVFMRHAKILITTSRQEGFSNVVIEAMYCGCPVISTRSGGPEEIITQQKTGILVNHNDYDIAHETINLLNDEAKRQRMVEHARRHVVRFLPEKICSQFSEILDQILDQNAETRETQR